MTYLPSYLSPGEVRRIHELTLIRIKTRLLMDSYDKIMEDRALSHAEAVERYFLCLATRLLRAKFYSFPAYSNQDLAYLTGCPTGSYLGQITARVKRPSADLARLMDSNLRKLEQREGMPPMYQPEYPVNEC